MKNLIIFILFIGLLISLPSFAQELSSREIVEKMDDKLRGETSRGTFKMSIVRPSWTREMTLKSWSKGNDYSLILVTAPARDKGTAFLKRKKEIWNWQPTIDRSIKLPPSMMMQSWMGSDFTNDDLVRESSTVEDYEHSLIGREQVDGRECYKINLIPKEDAPVVWGKVILWIDATEFMQLKAEFYDEDDYLVNTMLGKKPKEYSGKLLPSIMEVIPAEDEGHKTVIEYLNMTFDEPLDESFFSIRNMKQVR